MKQQDLGLNLSARRTRKAEFLDEMEHRHHVEYLVSVAAAERVLNTIHSYHMS